jgi:8-amino-7-oxononanoate synthase
MTASAALTAFERVRTDPTRRRTALERAEQLRSGLLRLGHAPMGYGHIVPWLIGDSREAVRIASSLRTAGFAVQAIRPPSVPPGTARIRFTASATQSKSDIEALLCAIEKL